MAESKKSIWKKIATWYDGTWKTLEGDNVLGVYVEHHWTAQVARSLVAFYLRNWQWLWGTIIGVAGLWVAVLALK